MPEARRLPLASRTVHPHQLRRWQDRYAVAAAAHAPSARLALKRLLSAL